MILSNATCCNGPYTYDGPEYVTKKACKKGASGPVHAQTHWTQRPTGQQLGIYTGVGVCDKINLPNKCTFYSVISVMLLGETTFSRHRQSTYFGDCNGYISLGTGSGQKMVTANTVVGSVPNPVAPTAPLRYASPTSDAADIRAMDLGLGNADNTGTYYTGAYCFNPSITNLVANVDAWFGLDNLIEGLYLRVRAPITYTSWDIGLNRAGEQARQQQYVQGFIEPIARNFPLPPLAPYKTTPSLISGGAALEGQQYVGMIPLMENGFITDRQSTTGVADLPVDIGLNFILKERVRAGASLHIVAPFGNTNDTHQLFGPRVGLGRWQVGTQAGMYYHFINNDTRKVSLYAEFCPCALLSCDERRMLGIFANNTTDFNHYLLLKEIRPAALTTAMPIPPPITDVLPTKCVLLERAANLLYQRVRLASTFNCDAAVWLRWQHHTHEFILGWDLTARSAEKLANPACRFDHAYIVDDANFGDDVSLYLIKGDTPMWVPALDDIDMPTAIVSQAPSPHCYDKSNSSINQLGTLIPLGSTAPAQDQATNPPTAITTNVLTQLQNAGITSADVSGKPTLHPSMLANALFAWWGYTIDTPDIDGFIGLGAQGEIGKNNATMNYGTVFLKGGLNF